MAVIDAWKGNADLPGAFLQADMPEDETVLVRPRIMVDTLLEHLYEPFVVQEGKAKGLYLELLKALYGTLREWCNRKRVHRGLTCLQ